MYSTIFIPCDGGIECTVDYDDISAFSSASIIEKKTIDGSTSVTYNVLTQKTFATNIATKYLCIQFSKKTANSITLEEVINSGVSIKTPYGIGENVSRITHDVTSIIARLNALESK